jgi:hypothetical protein
MRRYPAVLLVGLAAAATVVALALRRWRSPWVAALPAVRTRELTSAAIEMWTEYLDAIDATAPAGAVEAWARKYNVTRARIISHSSDRLRVSFERRDTGAGTPPGPGPIPTPAQKCRATFRGQGMWKGVLSNFTIRCICECRQVASGEWQCTGDPHDCTFEFTRA